MNKDQREIGRKLRILRYAEEIGHVAKRARQVTPWTDRADNPQHRLDEQPRIEAGATGITIPAKTVWGNDRPLRVGQCHSDQGYLPFGNLESFHR